MSRADSNVYTLASNASATGAAVQIHGGIYLFSDEGTPAGAAISLQIQSSNGTWSTVTVFGSAQVSAAVLPFAQSQVELPACNVRMAATGGAPSGLFSYLAGIG